MEGWPSRKTPEELNEQLTNTEETVGTRLAPVENIGELSFEELKERYKERYETYLKLLRAENSGQEIDPAELADMREWLQALNNLDSYIENHRVNEEERILRSRQFTIFEDIRNSLERGMREGYIKVPTGVGKTVLFSQVVDALKVKTLIVVPSKILVNQTGEKLEEFTDVEFGKYYQNVKDLSKNVTVITYSSLILAIERGELDPKQFGALILDEAHKGLGGKTVDAINKFECVKLGFTATPEYSDKKHVEHVLENRIHEMSILEAVREGMISRFKSIFAFTETDLSAVPVNRSGNFDEKSLEKAINTKARNLSAVKLYKEMFEGQRAVAYCGGVQHAKDLAQLFIESGVRAAAISGKTSPEQRKEILEKFNSGEIEVLCNAKLLIEGFDEPKAAVALNLHPTLSRVDAEQRAGRVLRLDRGNPEKWGYVVDFIDRNSEKTAITFPEVAQAAEAQYQKPPEFFDADARETLDVKDGSPRDFQHPEIEGLNVIVDVKEILSISKGYEEGRKELERAPDKWLNANQVSVKYNINHQLVQRYAKKYLHTNPEWFSPYKTEQGTVVEHYHPDLIQRILDDYKPLQTVELAPKNWRSGKMLSREALISYKTLNELLEPYRSSNPEWFKIHKNENNQVMEHYAPELSEKIVEEAKERRPKENWTTATRLRDLLHISEVTIRNFVEQYRESNPEWFEKKKNGPKFAEYYHPDLAKIIESHFPPATVENAPDKWKTVSQLVAKYGYDYDTTKKLGESYRAEHPEWFVNYKTRSKIAEHFHPDLIEKIAEWYEKRRSIPQAPDKWKNAYTLALELKRDTVKMKALAEPYRKTHPEWFMEYKAGHQVAEHYHPDLVERIKEDFRKK